MKRILKTLHIFMIIALLGTMAGCSGVKNTQISEEPKRIVSVAPSITELIYALGKGENLVGRTDYCDYPEETKEVPSIGSLIDPSVEKIVELNPDIVIATANFKEETYKKLEDLGIEVVVLYEAIDLEGAYDSIARLGQILNAEDEANRVITEIKDKIEEVQEKVKDAPRPKVYYVAGFGKNGDYTATGDTFIGQLLEIAGGDNIAKDATGWQYSLEKIIENDPDIILISQNYGLKEQFVETAGYKELSAVKGDKVIEIDDNLIARQGPRLGEGVESLAKIMHPDLFE
ncbi:MAG: cobalamin transport system substrate-binding protein [Epulopiscium sp.]|jgi:iron complex transport system substrate-binding protein|nr:ABC transporter substrate-binding protein [Defluviitalea raffinosedens]MBM7684570.1 iron complex transport system substrate-binding protein [Defluviitalea raffinosedens]MBZ4666990.1 transporter substrate-binding protein [Defluviitaleaceae bacterium]MDK2786796.1 cobalamin transport system substrate-binding protein [Candidatus Epulonipiscium sp.]